MQQKTVKREGILLSGDQDPKSPLPQGLGDEAPQGPVAGATADSSLGNSMDRGAWWGYSPYGCKELEATELPVSNVHGALLLE